MNPITEFSAAPHLPYSLRPESLASVLLNARAHPGDIIVSERDGEIYIDMPSQN